jgi:hypothetical protein
MKRDQLRDALAKAFHEGVQFALSEPDPEHLIPHKNPLDALAAAAVEYANRITRLYASVLED